MPETRTIYITQFDRDRLREVIRDAAATEYRGSPYVKALAGELERALVVDSKAVPPDVITMNSRFELEDLDAGEMMEMTLVFPQDADRASQKVSVLAPIGTAVLGYRVGDTVTWFTPGGETRLRVTRILYQPESAGDYDL